jgi:prepilin-type N-terminal cleavage/methylation domain-containing protein
MKHPNSREDGRAMPGFTMIEILITVSVIALLATLSLVAMGYATKVSNRKKTESYRNTIALFLDRYRNDNGLYPRPKEGAEGDTVSVVGMNYSVGGATTLYQALTGDGDDAIEGGDTASTGVPGSTPESEVYWADADPRGSHRITRENNGKWYVADGFGVPWQYKVPKPLDPKRPDAFQEEKDKYHNPKTYDLWSYGGTDEANIMNEKAWIKNW